jgi:hypothetical protein
MPPTVKAKIKNTKGRIRELIKRIKLAREHIKEIIKVYEKKAEIEGEARNILIAKWDEKIALLYEDKNGLKSAISHENRDSENSVIDNKIKRAREHIKKLIKEYEEKVYEDVEMRNILIDKWNAKIALLTFQKNGLKSAISHENRHLIEGSSENSVIDIEDMSSSPISDSSGGKSRRKYKSRKRRTRRNR